jgi:shikimate dehydrogenase
MLRSAENLVGFNVTIPYKQQIIPYLSGMSDEARAIGAVNCVRVLDDGSLVGYNTDVEGIRLTLDSLLGGKQIDAALVLGTGGASQAVQYVLRERSVPYLTVSRDSTKGDVTYEELRGEEMASHHLIINTSPVLSFSSSPSIS